MNTNESDQTIVSSNSGLTIPYGWYCVSYTDELAVAEIKPVHYFGEDLVLYRNTQGQACLAEAHCPHLGAHLGYGGSVDDQGLHCPFHGWVFNGEGHVVDISYAERIPPKVVGKACLKTYPVIEKSGFIWAWYHPSGDAPLYEIEPFAEIESGEWTDYKKLGWTINTNVQETGENAVDSAHFIYVHGMRDILSKPTVTFSDHKRESSLHLDFERINDSDSDGKPPIEGIIYTANSGPGQTWTRQQGFVDLLIIGLPIPINSDTLELRVACSIIKTQAESHADMAKMIIQNVVDQLNEDIPIWEHKIYRPDPVLCDGDGPIAQYRKWFQQFYV
jgi:phenylpropionate dioxygenase-like ring-hydroxylating dioxygenase large terminal subunit